MTLLLAMSNQSFAAVLGDRRLVVNRKVADDEANKICVLFCDDARVVIAFTGLAGFGKFRTQDWLRDTLYQIGSKKHTLDDILAEFQTQASRTFAKLTGKPQAIAFLISGFRYSKRAKNVCYLMSNFDSESAKIKAVDDLELKTLGTAGSVIVEAAGYKSVLTNKDYESLSKMLESGNSPPKVLRKTVEILRRVSKDKKTRGFIGAQCNSGIVLKRPNTNVVATYHSAKVSFRAYGPDVVLAVTNCVAAVTGTFLQAGMFLSGPEIKKNDPCWCDSGKTFKACHLKKFGSVYAKVPGFRKPMAWVVAFSKKEAELSGRSFVVTSSFT